MPWVIDGNNVLGRANVPREGADMKRQLVRELGRFARAKKTKVVCYFDGPEPEQFGKQLGGVTVVFSGRRAADELIAKRVANGEGWKVVTSDRGLAARVGGRKVEIVEPRRFLGEIEALPREGESASSDDWMRYFSDPKNRNVF